MDQVWNYLIILLPFHWLEHRYTRLQRKLGNVVQLYSQEEAGTNLGEHTEFSASIPK